MKLLKRIVFDGDKSLSMKFRMMRFSFSQNLLNHLSRPIRVLDVGGTEEYWRQVGFCPHEEMEITLLNLVPIHVSLPSFRSVLGDARDLSQFADSEFDVVFSNGVIQYLNYTDQQRMAAEIKRVGKRYIIQSPNRNFPVHHNYLIPFFQFLPIAAKLWLLTHFDIGIHTRFSDYEKARETIERFHMLGKSELIGLFPEASLYKERFCGFTKCFIAYHGW